jgi:hypothetical protein
MEVMHEVKRQKLTSVVTVDLSGEDDGRSTSTVANDPYSGVMTLNGGKVVVKVEKLDYVLHEEMKDDVPVFGKAGTIVPDASKDVVPVNDVPVFGKTGTIVPEVSKGIIPVNDVIDKEDKHESSKDGTELSKGGKLLERLTI